MLPCDPSASAARLPAALKRENEGAEPPWHTEEYRAVRPQSVFRVQAVSYAGDWVTASRSGGGLCWRRLDLDAVVEPDTLDDLRQLVLAL
jgi:hypothetical protein